ncbi:MAG: uroporphyrinogen-III synthase [Armatimonadota bacterium]|nr:uroporphyrinogen-III synthase [Armatimonadota bacterium]MDW8103697.1 uroporphyrinogen-III synthase [Armatimonadota bacterium]MDW8290299.1 uroporphyrinogen-III synthase [Armatimonadota bacterium]
MNLPLQGKRVLVTRPKGQEEQLVQKLQELGAEPLVLPAISILPPEDWEPVDEAIHQLETFHWVVFTSVNGVRSFIGRMKELGVPMSALAGRRLAAIGPATAAALGNLCRAPDVVPEQYLSDAVPDALGDVKGLRVLLPRADIARKEMALELRRRGAEVAEVAVYRVQQGGEELKQQLAQLPQPDYITLTSPSAVRSLAKMLEETGRIEWLATVPLVCIGPITAGAVRELGYQPACVAEEHTVEGLVQALVSLCLGAASV